MTKAKKTSFNSVLRKLKGVDTTKFTPKELAIYLGVPDKNFHYFIRKYEINCKKKEKLSDFEEIAAKIRAELKDGYSKSPTEIAKKIGISTNKLNCTINKMFDIAEDDRSRLLLVNYDD